MNRRWMRNVAVAAGMSLCVAACGSSGKKTSSAPPVAKPLTTAQAAQLASTLYLNYRDQGAHIDAQAVYSPTESIGVDGDVDFKDHTGHLVILTQARGQGQSNQSIDYSPTAVYEAVSSPSLPDGVGWTSRPPDPTDRPLDQVIQLIVALASPQRDNPLLVAQSQARWIGTQKFSGTTVNVYRYNPSITYWVGQTNGLLYRFIGTIQGFTGPITIDLTQRGPKSAAPPAASSIVPTPPTTTPPTTAGGSGSSGSSG